MDQQHRTTFCALEDARSSYKPAFFKDSGFLIDASLELHGGGLSRFWMDEMQGLGGFSCVKSVWDVFHLRILIVFAFSSFFAIATRCILSDGKHYNKNSMYLHSQCQMEWK